MELVYGSTPIFYKIKKQAIHSLKSSTNSLYLLFVFGMLIAENKWRLIMDLWTAMRNRILELCGERNITIDKLANISGLPASSVKNIL